MVPYANWVEGYQVGEGYWWVGGTQEDIILAVKNQVQVEILHIMICLAKAP